MGVVTGNFMRVDGTGINGNCQFALSSEALASSVACIAARTVSFPISAGSMTATVQFNDALLPATTSYQISVKETRGGQVWNGNYTFTGTAVANLNVILPQ